MAGYTTLIIDDFEPFRHFVILTLQQCAGFQTIYQASDGLEGVQRAEDLQPHLILLDIGLPRLNGIEAARRIGEVSPSSKILFISQESSADVAQEALSLGVHGYVLKSSGVSEILIAVKAVLRGDRFVSPCLKFKGGKVTP
jgi:DNA-binding NarL/FixJ family response regulator